MNDKSKPCQELVDALEQICGTTCIDGYGKVIQIADAALAKYKATDGKVGE